jgi:hypothetical protein
MFRERPFMRKHRISSVMIPTGRCGGTACQAVCPHRPGRHCALTTITVVFGDRRG